MLSADSKHQISNRLGLTTLQESKTETLEDELKEAPWARFMLQLIVLLGIYHHAFKGNDSDHSKRVSAARAAVSGLILVSKACGNDIQRYIRKHFYSDFVLLHIIYWWLVVTVGTQIYKPLRLVKNFVMWIRIFAIPLLHFGIWF